MAEIFGGIEKTSPANDAAAHLPEVKKALRKAAKDVYSTATLQLAEHRSDGHAEILLEKGKLDYFIVLSDERGDLAAASIEFGNRYSDGVAPLRVAMGTHISEGPGLKKPLPARLVRSVKHKRKRRRKHKKKR